MRKFIVTSLAALALIATALPAQAQTTEAPQLLSLTQVSSGPYKPGGRVYLSYQASGAFNEIRLNWSWKDYASTSYGVSFYGVTFPATGTLAVPVPTTSVGSYTLRRVELIDHTTGWTVVTDADLDLTGGNFTVTDDFGVTFNSATGRGWADVDGVEAALGTSPVTDAHFRNRTDVTYAWDCVWFTGKKNKRHQVAAEPVSTTVLANVGSSLMNEGVGWVLWGYSGASPGQLLNQVFANEPTCDTGKTVTNIRIITRTDTLEVSADGTNFVPLPLT